MSKDAVATMGEILPEDAGGRDAVHVAVFSGVSGERLFPSQDVAIVNHGEPDTLVAAAGEHIGIVDPYLKRPVNPGERFWVYLYPRSITGLSHRWSHPAFETASTTYAPPSQKLESEKWIRAYADELGDNYESLMAGADAWVSSGSWGEYYYGPETDGYRGALEGVSTKPEFWEHYERVRGVVVPESKRESFFTCSC